MDQATDRNAEGQEQQGEEQGQTIEEQLAMYARDLQELFLQHRGLSKTADETRQLFQLRAQEVSALNDFLRRRLTELFELESAYDTILERLEGVVDRLQPPMMREAIRAWIQEGRLLLQRLRNQRH